MAGDSGTVDQAPGAGDVGLLADQKGERQRLERFQRWFDQSWRADEPWRTASITARRYVSNQQWSEEDLQIRRQQKRPALTINKILPRVLFMEGYFRSQREEPQFLPFEGGDARACELMGALYKYEGSKCREPVVDSAVFDDKIVTGLGFWKLGWSFSGEDMEGDLSWERVDPLAVFPDPNWHDQGWENAEYVIQATWKTLEEAIGMWPEHEDELRRSYGEWVSGGSSMSTQATGNGQFAGDSLSAERRYWDAATQRARVLECWYKMHVQAPAVQRTDTGEITTDPDRVAMITKAVKLQPELAQAFRRTRVPTTRICLAHFMEDRLLDDQPSPYEARMFPLFPTRGYYWQKRPFGIVEPIIPLQDEINVRRSTIIEITQKSANSGFLNDETKGAKVTDLEKYAAGVGKVISHRGAAPQNIEPPQIPQTIVFLERGANQDIDTVSNINAELLGTTSQRTVSGKALARRQQSALTVQEPMMESFRQDKEPAVRFAIRLIQQFMAPVKAARILGTMVMRQPQGPLAEQMGNLGLIELQDLLRGAFDQQYDVVIGSQPFDPSMQMQRWSQLSELLQQFGPYVPPDVIVDALKKAGLLTEEQAQKTLAYAEQRLQMDQMQQAAATAGEAPAPPNRQAVA